MQGAHILAHSPEALKKGHAALGFLRSPARRAELDRALACAALDRTMTELYGPCRCPGARRAAAVCPQHAVDPGLFQRLLRAGLSA